MLKIIIAISAIIVLSALAVATTKLCRVYDNKRKPTKASRVDYHAVLKVK